MHHDRASRQSLTTQQIDTTVHNTCPTVSFTMEFHPFNNLPAELRVAIWKLAILEHNRDRMVLVNEHTLKIIGTKNIACSPHFRVSSESREVALVLYPLRLPLHWLQRTHPDSGGIHYVAEDATLSDEPPTQHAIYINTERDIFVPCGARMAPYSELYFVTDEPPPGGRPNWAWRAGLDEPLRREVRRIALFDFLDENEARADGCRRTCRCAFANDTLRYKTPGVSVQTDDFPEVQECLFMMVDPQDVDDTKLYYMVLKDPGRALVESFHQRSRIAWLNKDEMGMSGNQPGCVCDAPLPAWERRWAEFANPATWDPEHRLWR